MKAQAHSIQQLHIEFRLQGKLAQQGSPIEISEAMEARIHDFIDDELSRICPADKTLFIDKLVIDTATIDYRRFEADFLEKCQAALHAALQDQQFTVTDLSPKAPQFASLAASRLLALQHFLRNGSYPWWFQFAVTDHASNLVAAVVQENGAALLQWLIAHRQAPAVLQRLALQASPADMQILLASLLPTVTEAHFTVMRHLSERLATQPGNFTAAQWLPKVYAAWMAELQATDFKPQPPTYTHQAIVRTFSSHLEAHGNAAASNRPRITSTPLSAQELRARARAVVHYFLRNTSLPPWADDINQAALASDLGRLLGEVQQDFARILEHAAAMPRWTDVVHAALQDFLAAELAKGQPVRLLQRLQSIPIALRTQAAMRPLIEAYQSIAKHLLWLDELIAERGIAHAMATFWELPSEVQPIAAHYLKRRATHVKIGDIGQVMEMTQLMPLIATLIAPVHIAIPKITSRHPPSHVMESEANHSLWAFLKTGKWPTTAPEYSHQRRLTMLATQLAAPTAPLIASLLQGLQVADILPLVIAAFTQYFQEILAQGTDAAARRSIDAFPLSLQSAAALQPLFTAVADIVALREWLQGQPATAHPVLLATLPLPMHLRALASVLATPDRNTFPQAYATALSQALVQPTTPLPTPLQPWAEASRIAAATLTGPKATAEKSAPHVDPQKDALTIENAKAKISAPQEDASAAIPASLHAESPALFPEKSVADTLASKNAAKDPSNQTLAAILWFLTYGSLPAWSATLSATALLQATLAALAQPNWILEQKLGTALQQPATRDWVQRVIETWLIDTLSKRRFQSISRRMAMLPSSLRQDPALHDRIATVDALVQYLLWIDHLRRAGDLSQVLAAFATFPSELQPIVALFLEQQGQQIDPTILEAMVNAAMTATSAAGTPIFPTAIAASPDEAATAAVLHLLNKNDLPAWANISSTQIVDLLARSILEGNQNRLLSGGQSSQEYPWPDLVEGQESIPIPSLLLPTSVDAPEGMPTNRSTTSAGNPDQLPTAVYQAMATQRNTSHITAAYAQYFDALIAAGDYAGVYGAIDAIPVAIRRLPDYIAFFALYGHSAQLLEELAYLRILKGEDAVLQRFWDLPTALQPLAALLIQQEGPLGSAAAISATIAASRQVYALQADIPIPIDVTGKILRDLIGTQRLQLQIDNILEYTLEHGAPPTWAVPMTTSEWVDTLHKYWATTDVQTLASLRRAAQHPALDMRLQAVIDAHFQEALATADTADVRNDIARWRKAVGSHQVLQYRLAFYANLADELLHTKPTENTHLPLKALFAALIRIENPGTVISASLAQADDQLATISEDKASLTQKILAPQFAAALEQYLVADVQSASLDVTASTSERTPVLASEIDALQWLIQHGTLPPWHTTTTITHETAASMLAAHALDDEGYWLTMVHLSLRKGYASASISAAIRDGWDALLADRRPRSVLYSITSFPADIRHRGEVQELFAFYSQLAQALLGLQSTAEEFIDASTATAKILPSATQLPADVPAAITEIAQLIFGPTETDDNTQALRSKIATARAMAQTTLAQRPPRYPKKASSIQSRAQGMLLWFLENGSLPPWAPTLGVADLSGLIAQEILAGSARTLSRIQLALLKELRLDVVVPGLLQAFMARLLQNDPVALAQLLMTFPGHVRRKASLSAVFRLMEELVEWQQSQQEGADVSATFDLPPALLAIISLADAAASASVLQEATGQINDLLRTRGVPETLLEPQIVAQDALPQAKPAHLPTTYYTDLARYYLLRNAWPWWSQRAAFAPTDADERDGAEAASAEATITPQYALTRAADLQQFADLLAYAEAGLATSMGRELEKLLRKTGIRAKLFVQYPLAIVGPIMRLLLKPQLPDVPALVAAILEGILPKLAVTMSRQALQMAILEHLAASHFKKRLDTSAKVLQTVLQSIALRVQIPESTLVTMLPTHPQLSSEMLASVTDIADMTAALPQPMVLRPLSLRDLQTQISYYFQHGHPPVAMPILDWEAIEEAIYAMDTREDADWLAPTFAQPLAGLLLRRFLPIALIRNIASRLQMIKVFPTWVATDAPTHDAEVRAQLPALAGTALATWVHFVTYGSLPVWDLFGAPKTLQATLATLIASDPATGQNNLDNSPSTLRSALLQMLEDESFAREAATLVALAEFPPAPPLEVDPVAQLPTADQIAQELTAAIAEAQRDNLPREPLISDKRSAENDLVAAQLLGEVGADPLKKIPSVDQEIVAQPRLPNLGDPLGEMHSPSSYPIDAQEVDLIPDYLEYTIIADGEIVSVTPLPVDVNESEQLASIVEVPSKDSKDADNYDPNLGEGEITTVTSMPVEMEELEQLTPTIAKVQSGEEIDAHGNDSTSAEGGALKPPTLQPIVLPDASSLPTQIPLPFEANSAAAEAARENAALQGLAAKQQAADLIRAILQDPQLLERYAAKDLQESASEEEKLRQREELNRLRAQEMEDSIAHNAEGIMVYNAGLVILWPFFTRFFRQLGLLDKGKWIDETAQMRAVFLLQYLVDFQEWDDNAAAPEHLLMFNKILCGLPIEAIVTLDAPLTDLEKEHAPIVLRSAMQNWKAMERTSIDGFQRSFLFREGLLSRRGEHWNLKVVKRTYDQILSQLEWSLSVIKLPYNDYFIYIEWI